MEKPHKGGIEQWLIIGPKGKQVVLGVAVGHPQFHGRDIRTSWLINREGAEIETLNSRYTLIGPGNELCTEK